MVRIFFNINLGDGDIAILDGTNTRVSRRKLIDKYLNDNLHRPFKLIWIESICTLKEVIEKNIMKTKITSPDYKNWQDVEKAAVDFRQRIEEYEKVYETLSLENDGDQTAFIQIINEGTHIIMRNIRGYMESKILSYLINLHTGDRPIYFTRHGESEYNKKGLIGGESDLSDLGEKFSENLASFFKEESRIFNDFKEPPIIYCSTMRRAIHTAEKLKYINEYISMKNLDEINSGLRDGMSYDEVKEKYPQEHEERNKDKLHYRYPRGESYMDVIQRIEPMIYELERRRGPVIIVAHLGVIRCLYGYFACVPIEMIPTLDMPLHTIIKFIPEAYGFSEERFIIDPLIGTVTKDDKPIVKFPDQLNHIPKSP